MRFNIFFNFAFLVVILSSCKITSEYQINSSIEEIDILVDNENKPSYFNSSYLRINDSIDIYTYPFEGKLFVYNNKINSLKKTIVVPHLIGSQFFSLIKYNENIIYCLKTPYISDRTHKNLITKVNVLSGEVISIFSPHNRLFFDFNDPICSKDSAIHAFFFSGSILSNNKIFFLNNRYVSPSESTFFLVRAPLLGFFSIEHDSIVLINGINPPLPLGNYQLFINDIASSITEGHDNFVVVCFNYTDSIYLINTITSKIIKKRTDIFGIKALKGFDKNYIELKHQVGVYENPREQRFEKIFFDKYRNEYWRFVKFPSDSLSARQVNEPLYGYCIYDTSFSTKYLGILPRNLNPYPIFESDRIIFARNRSLDEFKNDTRKVIVKLSKNVDGSKREMEQYFLLGKDALDGWSNYSKKILKLKGDTIKLIAIPSYSCPSCIFNILSRKDRMQKIKELNYNLLLLASSAEKKQILNLFPEVYENHFFHDEKEFHKFILPFYNPHIIIIIGDSVIMDKYLNPDEVESIENVIGQIETSLKK